MDELTIARMKTMRESGMTYKEIGVQIGISKTTVMHHICAATQLKRKEYAKKYQECNKELVREWNRRYYQNSNEEVNERRREQKRECSKKYRDENKERVSQYNKEYRKNNIECIKRYSKEYDEKNLEHRKCVQKEYYSKNRERVKEASKQYQQKNKNKSRVSKNIRDHKREAIKKSLEHTFTKKDWVACLKHFNNKCAYCGSETSALQQDHVVPISKKRCVCFKQYNSCLRRLQRF
jgi:exonuclease VII large subunit